MKKRILLGAAALTIAAVGAAKVQRNIPPNATVVSPFDVNKYLGDWYEIARLDFIHEKHLSNTTAQYSLHEDGSIRVKNRGYHEKKKKWKESIGKAKFRNSPNEGALKVSFFGPFYSGYNVVAIDSQYQNVLVAGKNLDYLWILSRKPTITKAIKNKYLKIAQEIGYNTDKLVWVNHDRKDETAEAEEE